MKPKDSILTHPKHYGLLSRNGFIFWEELGFAIALPNLRELLEHQERQRWVMEIANLLAPES